jgi:hypothetical protein
MLILRESCCQRLSFIDVPPSVFPLPLLLLAGQLIFGRVILMHPGPTLAV